MTTLIDVLRELKRQGDIIPDATPLAGYVQAEYMAEGLREQGHIQASTMSVAGKLRHLRTLGQVDHNYFNSPCGYWRLTPGGGKEVER